MPVRLYVGNLPTKQPIERDDLKSVFAESSELVSTPKVPTDRKGHCKGFAFITVANDDLAEEIIEKYNGQEFMGNALKIEKALPRTKTKEKEKEKDSEESTTSSEQTQTQTPKPSKKTNNKRNRKQNQTNTQSDSQSVQPDPRWAEELAILKERLATQTSNS